MAHMLTSPGNLAVPQEQVSNPSAAVRPWRLLTGLEVGFACLVLLAGAGCKSNSPTTASEPSTAAKAVPATASTAKAAPLSAEDIKAMKDRDDYATRVAKELHVRLPAYKNVKIYANSWAGAKAPSSAPLADIRERAGDNLMLVFWSPDADTAKGLADFTKSHAAVDAVNAGFAEFQFVDPSNYCYAQVTPVGAIGAPVCGIR